MIQNVIRDLGGIAAFGVISICLFFAVFTGAMVFALIQKKSFCDHMRSLPLDDGLRERSADFQSAGSQVCNLHRAARLPRAQDFGRTDPSRAEPIENLRDECWSHNSERSFP